MDRELTRRLHQDYLKVYRINGMILDGIFLLIIVAYAIVAIWKEWTLIPLWISLPLLAISAILNLWIIPKIKYMRFRYELFDEELEIQSGMIFISNVLIPMVRVQHVEVGSGPLMRKFDLASVSIVTAATTHEISGLKQADAEKLKRQIGILARVDEENE